MPDYHISLVVGWEVFNQEFVQV